MRHYGPVVRNGVYDAAHRGWPVMPVHHAGGGYYGQSYGFRLSVTGDPQEMPGFAASASATATTGYDDDGDYTTTVNESFSVSAATHAVTSRTGWTVWEYPASYSAGDSSAPRPLLSPGCEAVWMADGRNEGADGAFEDWERRCRFKVESVFQPYYGDGEAATWNGLEVPKGVWTAGVTGYCDWSCGAGGAVRTPGNYLIWRRNGATTEEKHRIYTAEAGYGGSDSDYVFWAALFQGPAQHRVHAGAGFTFLSATAGPSGQYGDQVPSWCQDFISQVAFRLETTGPR